MNFVLICLDFSFLTEPNAPPSNVNGHSVNATSIFVQWDQVPAEDQNGVILSYTVTYGAFPVCSTKTKNVTTPGKNFTFSGLNEFTNYSITVFASTVKGNGNVSAAIYVTTDQYGKCTFLVIFLLVLQNPTYIVAIHFSSGKGNEIQPLRVPIYCRGVLA